MLDNAGDLIEENDCASDMVKEVPCEGIEGFRSANIHKMTYRLPVYIITNLRVNCNGDEEYDMSNLT
jgi:hypothetical protein